MNRPSRSRLRPVALALAVTALLGLVGSSLSCAGGSASSIAMTSNPPTAPAGETRYQIGRLLHADDFDGPSLERWQAELEKGGTITAREGKLVIDVPGGCTLWFEPRIEGPVMIEYEATVIDAGGPNDRVSDLNCFWMARDARSPEDIFATQRSGKFSDYDQLRTYYVGQGGNANTTTRFRRYIGRQDDRPLLPEHDLREEDVLLKPNQTQTVRLVACDGLIQYFHNDRKLFELNDPEPYTSGWFGFRTVANHMKVDNFRVYRLEPVAAPSQGN